MHHVGSTSSSPKHSQEFDKTQCAVSAKFHSTFEQAMLQNYVDIRVEHMKCRHSVGHANSILVQFLPFPLAGTFVTLGIFGLVAST